MPLAQCRVNLTFSLSAKVVRALNYLCPSTPFDMPPYTARNKVGKQKMKNTDANNRYKNMPFGTRFIAQR